MKKSGLLIGFLAAFVLLAGDLFATQDSLVLYTKADCSNCRSVKMILRQHGIFYTEKSLEKDENAMEMLQKLSLSAYHKEILLPVIYLNSRLLHPAYVSDTGLVTVPLQDVVDSIRHQVNRGQIVLKGDNIAETPEINQQNSDCDLKVSPVYLICAAFNTEAEAKALMNKLITDGYTYAGYIQQNKQFSVFSKFYYDSNSANQDLPAMKKIFGQAAYLLEL